MPKIMVELFDGSFQYVTQIDSRLPLSENNIGYSIYPHRAVDEIHIDQVREMLPGFNFMVAYHEKKPHGLTGNKNAAKPDDQKAESHIHARCKSSDKAMWVIASKSKGMKLTEWIVSVLNDAIKK